MKNYLDLISDFMAIDPVCKMEVDEKRSIKITYKNKAYYFCSDACKKTFEENPETFIN